MKIAKDKISRSQVQWLALHALAITCLGLVVMSSSWEETWKYRPTYGAVFWTIAFFGGCDMIIAGVSLFAASLTLLRRPFPKMTMDIPFWKIALSEAVVVFLMGGLILDGGEFGARVAILCLLINTALLGFKTM